MKRLAASVDRSPVTRSTHSTAAIRDPCRTRRTQTQFERESRWPNQRIALYYDSWEALAARGIIRARPVGEPDPFPLGFVPDPY